MRRSTEAPAAAAVVLGEVDRVRLAGRDGALGLVPPGGRLDGRGHHVGVEAMMALDRGFALDGLPAADPAPAGVQIALRVTAGSAFHETRMWVPKASAHLAMPWDGRLRAYARTDLLTVDGAVVYELVPKATLGVVSSQAVLTTSTGAASPHQWVHQVMTELAALPGWKNYYTTGGYYTTGDDT